MFSESNPLVNHKIKYFCAQLKNSMNSTEQLKQILEVLRTYSDYDLREYAEGSLLRRIERIRYNFKLDFKGLLTYLQSGKAACDRFVEEITVNTTELFRDHQVWIFLRTHIMPELEKRHHINLWISGCSTGQEVYSFAILLDHLNLLQKTTIYATDINRLVIETAQKGVYRYRNNLDYLLNFEKVIGINPLNFDETNESLSSKYIQINKEKDLMIFSDFLKKKIIYQQHDLVKNPPLSYGKFDLISCRNVLIYMNQSLQTKILSGYHEQLANQSYLLLGINESILGASALKYKKKGSVYIKT